MVELTGTPAQITWATTIRNDNIRTLETEIADLTKLFEIADGRACPVNALTGYQ